MLEYALYGMQDYVEGVVVVILLHVMSAVTLVFMFFLLPAIDLARMEFTRELWWTTVKTERSSWWCWCALRRSWWSEAEFPHAAVLEVLGCLESVKAGGIHFSDDGVHNAAHHIFAGGGCGGERCGEDMDPLD